MTNENKSDEMTTNTTIRTDETETEMEVSYAEVFKNFLNEGTGNEPGPNKIREGELQHLTDMETGVQYRNMVFELRENDPDTRQVALAFSSTEPVERSFGNEVLLHGSENVSLIRLQNKAPLLVNHDLNDQVGVVERATVNGETGRAIVRFGRSQKADEIYQDVVDGIRSQVSVGYRIHEMEKTSDEPVTYEATRWEPFEVSIVSVGADQTVGIGRSSTETFNTRINERVSKMETSQIEVREEPVAVDTVKIESEVRKNELDRIKEIESYGAEHNQKELAREFIQEQRSVAEFQTAILDIIKNRPEEKVHAIGLTKKETRNFSWMKLIRAMANPHDRKLQEDASFEFEASRAQADKNGIDPQGSWVPADVIYGQSFEEQKRDLTVGTNTAGGFTVQTDVLASSFIDVLRANMVFSAVGITELNGLNGKVSIPGSDAGSTAYWVAENGAVTESDQTFIARSLDGKTVGAMTDVARNLMLQSSIDVEAFVRNDIAMSLATEIEVKGLTGNGTSNTPIGVYNTTGVGGTTINATDAPDWGDIVDIWNGVSSNNALRGNLAWVGGSTITANCMKAFRNSGGSAPILDDGVGNDGVHRLMTYPYHVSENNVEGAKSLLTFGDWSSLVMGSWGNGLDLLVDPFTNSSTGATRVVGLYLVDFAVRTPKSFSASVNP